MKLFFKLITLIIVSVAIFNNLVFATPTTIIWVLSTDVQAFGTYRLGIEIILQFSENGLVKVVLRILPIWV